MYLSQKLRFRLPLILLGSATNIFFAKLKKSAFVSWLKEYLYQTSRKSTMGCSTVGHIQLYITKKPFKVSHSVVWKANIRKFTTTIYYYNKTKNTPEKCFILLVKSSVTLYVYCFSIILFFTRTFSFEINFKISIFSKYLGSHGRIKEIINAIPLVLVSFSISIRLASKFSFLAKLSKNLPISFELTEVQFLFFKINSFFLS